MKNILSLIHSVTALIFLISNIIGFGVDSDELFLMPYYIIYLAVILLPLVFDRYIHNKNIVFLGRMLCLVPALIIFFYFPMYGAIFLFPFHVSRIVKAVDEYIGRFRFLLYLLNISFLLILPIDSYSLFLILSFCCAIIEAYMVSSEKSSHRLWRKYEELQKQNDTLSMALQNAKQNNQLEVYYQNLEDRSQLAQKLHDEVGHTLTASIYQLQAAAELQKTKPEKATEMQATVIEVLQKGMQSIRATLRNLRPDESELGIQQIKSNLAAFSVNHEIQTDLQMDGDINVIPFKIWKDISLNLQELLTNSLRYSEANKCTLVISVYAGIIKVAFKDNGKGCEKIKLGMGLGGIENRVADLSGNTIFDGSNGFSVIMLYKREAQ